MVFPCVGVGGYPVRTECGHACGGQDLQTHFFIRWGKEAMYLMKAYLAMGMWRMGSSDEGGPNGLEIREVAARCQDCLLGDAVALRDLDVNGPLHYPNPNPKLSIRP